MQSSKKIAESAASTGASLGASIGGKLGGPVGAGIGGGLGGATGYVVGELTPDFGCCSDRKLLPDGGQPVENDATDSTRTDEIIIPVTEE